MGRKRVIILGAAGRDFHVFNMVFRDNSSFEVVAFTAAQIPNISGRVYPPELAGPLYPNGIPIYDEDMLPELIRKFDVDLVVLAYSDLLHTEVMHKASLALASGASFMLLGPKETMIESKKPVIAVCATRTGAGKSTVTRKISNILKELRISHVIIRHPMPYGNLKEYRVQRFTSLKDLDRYKCTIEEREEYEPHLEREVVVYSGIDCREILKQAEKEADVIIWDGGNNDFPFIKPDLMITVTDPLRAGHEVNSYPGEVNLRMADIVIINKINVASPENIRLVRKNIKLFNPEAVVIEAESIIIVDRPELIASKRVLVIEDGPTVTHGHLGYGAGYMAAVKYGAREIVDPRPYAIGSIRKVYEEYPHIGPVLPAMGYGETQVKELEETVKNTPCDSIVLGTPADISRLMSVNKPATKVRYELKERGTLTLRQIVIRFLSEKLGKKYSA
ncbi:MAG: GTPase [Thermoprotei archaeon]|nr:MAG: GTPase [Thermoprotei archaeon]RLE82437.1 MAG: GTPase [Thermoprotei archaeon]RLF02771.1 MAG: GTPase [Thermoprotei archaeon]